MPSTRMSAVATAVLVRAGAAVNRTFVLPLLMFSPTSGCNSRCVSCDWWKRSEEDDLTLEEIAGVARVLPALGTRLVVFSGGEPLLRPEVFSAAELFRAEGARLHLLTSGVLLERRAEGVARAFERVVVSLDATSRALYGAVRGVAALDTVEAGVAKLRRLAPEVVVTARSTLHRMNFRELPGLIDHAKSLGLDGISFLAADVDSTAFGRTAAPGAGSGLLLTRDEVGEFEALVDRTIDEYAADIDSGFVAQSGEKLRRLPRHYRAALGDGPFPAPACDAPWVSAVVDANGDVRPCFFHAVIGNVRRDSLRVIVEDHLPAFRRGLDVQADATCRRCVCSLKTGWRSAPWL